MRLSTGEHPDEEAGARDDRRCGRRGNHRLRHGACLRRQRGASRPSVTRVRRARARADRDEGRDDERRRRLGSRRPSEGDPRRLRGEPRCARRAADRPLPPARARSTYSVAHIGARARTSRRRRSRAQSRPRERQPPATRRGARTGTGCRCPGRAQPVRQPRATRGHGRPVRRGRDCGDGALAPRRSRPRGARRPGRGACPRRGCEQRDSGGGSARVAARALARGRADPRSTPTGDGALCSAVCRARPRRRRRLAVLTQCLRASARRAATARSGSGAGGRRRDGQFPAPAEGRVAGEYVERGYVRLNRDERGGTLRALVAPLEEALASPEPRVVLDNTYLTRDSRSYVLDAAARHGAPVRCVWLDTPLAQAQVEPHGTPARPVRTRCPAPPTCARWRSVSRACSHRRRRCAPSASSSRRRSTRDSWPSNGSSSPARRIVRAVKASSSPRRQCGRAAGPPRAMLLTSCSTGFPTARADALAAEVERVAVGVTGCCRGGRCARHPGGPPTCWCRPPLPGLILAFARAHDVDLSRSTLVGTSSAHRTLATTLGARFVAA